MMVMWLALVSGASNQVPLYRFICLGMRYRKDVEYSTLDVEMGEMHKLSLAGELTY